MKLRKHVIQIAGYNQYNYAYRDHLMKSYRGDLSSILIKLNGEVEVTRLGKVLLQNSRLPKLLSLNKIAHFVYDVWLVAQFVLNCNKMPGEKVFFVEEWVWGIVALFLCDKSSRFLYFKVDYSYDNRYGTVKTFLRNTLVKNIEGTLVKRADRTLFFNSYIKDRFEDMFNQRGDLSGRFHLVGPVINRIRAGRKDPNQFLFFGLLRRDQRIEEIFAFIKSLKTGSAKVKPVIHLVGAPIDPQYLEHLKRLAAKLSIESNVVFYGYRDFNDAQLEKLAGKCGFAFATFDKTKSAHTYFAWPSKIMLYIKYSIPFFYIKGSLGIEPWIKSMANVLEIEKFDFKKMAKLMKTKSFSRVDKATYTRNRLSISNYL